MEQSGVEMVARAAQVALSGGGELAARTVGDAFTPLLLASCLVLLAHKDSLRVPAACLRGSRALPESERTRSMLLRTKKKWLDRVDRGERRDACNALVLPLSTRTRGSYKALNEQFNTANTRILPPSGSSAVSQGSAIGSKKEAWRC